MVSAIEEFIYQSDPSTATPTEDVCGPQGRLRLWYYAAQSAGAVEYTDCFFAER